jgi:hypothetical protein
MERETAMAEWNKNNLAHTNTFLALRILAQTKAKFSTAGSHEMKKLAFWVAGESADMRAARAKSLASQMHNLFVMVFGSRLESGATNAGAVKAMADVLVVSDSTVNELADRADENYDFSEDV